MLLLHLAVCAMTAVRIATKLLLIVLLCMSGAAYALIPQTSQVGVVNGSTIVATGPTKLAACQAWAVKFLNGNPSYTFVVDDGPIINTQCNIKQYWKADGSYLGTSTFGFQATLACPANSTLSGTQCLCNADYVENSTKTACELPPDPCKGLKGQSAGTWWKDQGDDNGKPMKVGFSTCDRYNSVGGGLCVVTVGNGPDTLCVQASGGFWQCSGPGYYTGSKAANPAKCNVGPSQGSGGSPEDPAPASPPVSENPPKPPLTPAPGTAAPAPCPSGQAPGEFNGSRVCAPVGSDRPTASGSGSSTTTNNSDGSSTTSTTSGTTTCAQGACNTTTNNTNTTINAPGNSSCPAGQASGTMTVNGQSRTTCTGTSSSTSTQPQATFCKENPKDKQCGGDGSDTGFGGSCAGGFKAISDNAVLNAMAEEQYRQNCKMYGDPDSKPQVIPKQTKTATLGTVTVGGWGSSCPAPITAVAMGQTFQMSFQSFCDTAPLVRPLVLLACALLSMSIVYSALRGTQ